MPFFQYLCPLDFTIIKILIWKRVPLKIFWLIFKKKNYSIFGWTNRSRIPIPVPLWVFAKKKSLYISFCFSSIILKYSMNINTEPEKIALLKRKFQWRRFWQHAKTKIPACLSCITYHVQSRWWGHKSLAQAKTNTGVRYGSIQPTQRQEVIAGAAS